MSTIVLLATAWGSKHGGINVVNMELTRALAEMFGASQRVLCVVPHAQESEVDDAKKSGAVLVSLGLERSSLPDFFDPGWLGTAVKKLAEAGASTVDWCIGHDAITGAAANAMKRDKAANASAVICHMSYADYQGVKHPEYPDIESKIREQRQILKAADAVIAVGPLLSNRAFNIVDRLVPMLVPGLPSIKPRPLRTQFEAISFGRFERTNDRIKQIQLAAEGLAEARRRAGEPGGPRVLRDNPTLKLIGVSRNDAESSSLRQVMQTRAKQIVNLRPMPYQEDRHELYEEIAGSSAALMLSWHEGFGLTGWEAIAAEVPLIVSEQSGLYVLLYKSGLHGFVRSLRVDGSYGGDDETPNFTDEDRRRVADHILEVAHDPDVARGMARNLKESLIAQGCTWPNAARAVLQALGITPPAPMAPPGPESFLKSARGPVTGREPLVTGPSGPWAKPSAVIDAISAILEVLPAVAAGASEAEQQAAAAVLPKVRAAAKLKGVTLPEITQLEATPLAAVNVAFRVDEPHRELLREVLQHIRENKELPMKRLFRMRLGGGAVQARMDRLDTLEREALLDAPLGYYFPTLTGLRACDSDEGRRLAKRCTEVLRALQRAYQADPCRAEPTTPKELAKVMSVPDWEVAFALTVLWRIKGMQVFEAEGANFVRAVKIQKDIIKVEAPQETLTRAFSPDGAIKHTKGRATALTPVATLVSREGNPVRPLVWQLEVVPAMQHDRTKTEVHEALAGSVVTYDVRNFGRVARWPRVLVAPQASSSTSGESQVWTFPYSTGVVNVVGDEQLAIGLDGSVMFQRDTFQDMSDISLDFGMLAFDIMCFMVFAAQFALRLGVGGDLTMVSRVWTPQTTPGTLALFYNTCVLPEQPDRIARLPKGFLEGNVRMIPATLNDADHVVLCKRLLDRVANEFQLEDVPYAGYRSSGVNFLAISAPSLTRLAQQLAIKAEPF